MKEKRPDPVCDQATIVAVQRIIAGAFLAAKPAAHQYTEAHDLVDCNSLLDIPDDSQFVDAAFRQIQGREVTDRRHRRWVRRLRIISRAFMLLCLRHSQVGKQHGARTPGLAHALLLDQPRRGLLRIPLAGPALTRLRHKAVRNQVACHRSDT